MSSDEAAGDEGDLEPVTFIRMQAEDTFDGQERVMTKAAYDLQCRATSHSASCGHPGYVPDDYLEHLDGLGIETTITAAELCAIGTWERVGGGYRILDWEGPPGQPRTAWGLDLTLEQGDLVTQDQDLGVLGAVRAGEQGEPAEHTQHRQVGES